MSHALKSHVEKLERLAPAKPYLPFLLMCLAIFITIIVSTVVCNEILNAQERAIGDAEEMVITIDELESEKSKLNREIAGLEREKKGFERTLETKLRNQKFEIERNAKIAVDNQLMAWTKESNEEKAAFRSQLNEALREVQTLSNTFQQKESEWISNTKLYEGKIQSLTREIETYKQRLSAVSTSSTPTSSQSAAPSPRKSIDPINDPINMIKGIFNTE